MTDKVETIEYWADGQVISSTEVLARYFAEHPEKYDQAVTKWKARAGVLDRARAIRAGHATGA